MKFYAALDKYWVIPAWILGGLIALGLGLVVGFLIYAPGVVRQFDAVLSQTSNNTLVYDSEDQLIATIEGQEDRHSVPISRIHPYLQKAVVAIEDRRFFAHRGMDPVRLMGALWADIKSLAYEQGASTITQQLVKLTLLSSERTLTRKVREIFMAVAMEQAYPKLTLLEFYLNRVYLGNGVYGVEKASRAYFDKSAAKLTLSEAAFLAALIKKPEGYMDFPGQEAYASEPLIPVEKLTALMNRRQLVLRTMAELGWIGVSEWEEAKSAELLVHRPKDELVNAPFFVQKTLKELREKMGRRRISGRGYRVYTTLDSSMQRQAQARIEKIGRQFPATPPPEGEEEQTPQRLTRQASLIALDPVTGYVRALVGGVDYQTSQFNRATQAIRQPGSAIKPFLYAAALENGLRTNSVFLDEAITYTWDGLGEYQRLFEEDTQIDLMLSLDQLEALGEDSVYTPRNYDQHYGLPGYARGNQSQGDWNRPQDRRMTLSRALELSSNVIAVQLLNKVGLSTFVRMTERWNLPMRRENGLCIALGCSEVTLADLTAGYAAFANGGLRVAPVYIRRVTNIDGDVIFEHFPDAPVEVMSSWTAFQMRHLLAGVLDRGTGRRARLSRPAGGKTGTNEGPRDTWFIGFTPKLVAGVWMGYDNNEFLPNEVGGRTTATLWREFMTAVLPPYRGETFPEPEEEYVSVRVCNLDGRPFYPECPDSSAHFFREKDLTPERFAETLNTVPALAGFPPLDPFDPTGQLQGVDSPVSAEDSGGTNTPPSDQSLPGELADPTPTRPFADSLRRSFQASESP